MIDWKRCRKLLDEDAGREYGRFGRAPFGHLLDNPCNHYFVQQNVYAVILGRYYGVYLSSMSLCHIHPSYDSYHLIEVPDLRQQADMILDEYALGRTELMPWELELPCKSSCGWITGVKKPRLN